VLNEGNANKSYFELVNILKDKNINRVHKVIIQGVPGGKDPTSGECSLGQTIPI
jgi:hypothetical protein